MRRREEIQVNVAGLRRNLKNFAHNYSEAQVKVREATSNDHWGPCSTLMSEIADLTYNVVAFTEIMQMIWKRLNDHGRNWRHVYKALVLLEYLIKTGSEKVSFQCKENIHSIQTLRDFQYFEEGKDPGLNVREKAKQLVSLLKDDERLRNERARALKAKERFAQTPSGFGSEGSPETSPSSSSPQIWQREEWNSFESQSSTPTRTELECERPQTAGEEELQLQLALAMSREEAEQEEQKRRSDDVRLQLAISQSQKETKKKSSTPTSHLNDLLEIDPALGLTSKPTSSNTDPWKMSVSSTVVSQSQNDPWSAPKAASPPPDPWMPIEMSVIKNENTWPVNLTTDSNLITNHAQSSIKVSDPWAPQSIPADDFTLLSNRNTNTSTSNHNGNQSSNAFDFSALQNGLINNSNNSNILDGTRKTPQSFLGENSALVNLDNLITPPTTVPTIQAPVIFQKTGPANPFGSATTTTTFQRPASAGFVKPSSPTANPFSS